MSQTRTYLDFNATAPLRPEARAAVVAAMDSPGNASSVHREGRDARALIEAARRQVAALAGVSAAGLVFTSGGTEAANLALTPSLRIGRDRRDFDVLLIAAGEHACVLEGHRFASEQVVIVPLEPSGRIDCAALDEALADNHGKRPLLALQAANNETGVIQPVAEAAGKVRAAGGATVCDAVQAFGRIPSTGTMLGAELLIVSAHKLGGPKGVGALAFAAENDHIRDVLIRGGGQERGQRAGTESVAAIAGFGAVAEAVVLTLSSEADVTKRLRDQLEKSVLQIAPDAVIFGADVERLPNTSCFAVPGASAETLLIALDLDGVAVSSGSACSSGKVGKSHVLAAMGVDPALASGAIRVSFGWSSCEADVQNFADAFAKAIGRIQRRRAA
ncbi:MAG: cysteine desulfurase [Methylobacteriaceae bacterium]|nr:cysteine desulfurase [Methylobacteriaceae bacterium]MBV9394758.1 cysteine desulfurase [Methylobacteriaceae bacterium]